MPIVEPCGKEDKRVTQAWRTGVHPAAAVPGLTRQSRKAQWIEKGDHNEIGDSRQIRFRL